MSGKKLGLKYKLLSVINSLPEGPVALAVVLSEYEAKYKNEMPASDFEINASGNVRWKHSLQGEITECRDRGFLVSPTRGYWQITEDGRQWLMMNMASFDHMDNLPDKSPGRQVISEGNPQIDNGILSDSEAHCSLDAFADFYVPLMKTLDGLPNRTGQSYAVLTKIKHQYGSQISPYQLEKADNGRVRWIYNVRMCRQHLLKRGFIESPAKGIWRLSDQGHEWLMAHPTATHLSGNKNSVTLQGSSRSASKKQRDLSRISADLQLLGQAKITILHREIDNIRSYLDGRSSIQPSDEKLCDWVQFCYIFEMYNEGNQLFLLVSSNEVHPWYYERTKKLARLCAMRASRD